LIDLVQGLLQSISLTFFTSPDYEKLIQGLEF